jgi:cell division topological specificity factor
MGLLTDIYNTVARFFRSQDGQVGEDASKSVAQNRLKLVLMQDRTNLTPKVLEQMRGEMIDLLSKYLEMDKDLLELNFEQDENIEEGSEEEKESTDVTRCRGSKDFIKKMNEE